MIKSDPRYQELPYRTLIDQAAPDGMFVHDHDGNFIDVNKQACTSVGYTKKELLTMKVMDLETDFDLKSAQAAWSLMNPAETKILFSRHRHKNGSKFPVEIHIGLLIFEGQRLYVAFVRNITERIKSETAQKESETKLSLFIEHAPCAIAMFDHNMRYLAASRRWIDDFVLGNRTIIGQSHYELFPMCPSAGKKPINKAWLATLSAAKKTLLHWRTVAANGYAGK